MKREAPRKDPDNVSNYGLDYNHIPYEYKSVSLPLYQIARWFETWKGREVGVI